VVRDQQVEDFEKFIEVPVPDVSGEVALENPVQGFCGEIKNVGSGVRGQGARSWDSKGEFLQRNVSSCLWYQVVCEISMFKCNNSSIAVIDRL
jgi:hypothetical protein